MEVSGELILYQIIDQIFNGQVGYSQWEVFVSYVSTSTSQSNSSGCSEMLSIGGSSVGSTLDRDNYNNPFNSTLTTAEKHLHMVTDIAMW